MLQPPAQLYEWYEMNTSMDTDKPVMLVHGYMDRETSSWWDDLEDELTARGYDDDDIYRATLSESPLFSMVPYSGFGTTVSSPQQYADELGTQIEDLSDTYEDSVNIIAHSMGGLDARYYIEEKDGDEHVDTLVTVGTPHRGTTMSYLGLHTGGGQAMRPGSGFLETLNDDGLAEETTYVALWTENDEVIRPPTNAKLPSEPEKGGSYHIDVDSTSIPFFPSATAHLNLLRDDEAIETYLSE